MRLFERTPRGDFPIAQTGEFRVYGGPHGGWYVKALFPRRGGRPVWEWARVEDIHVVNDKESK